MPDKMLKSMKRNDFKILLLGAENSGKTTFLNKMRFMFGHHLSQEEMEKYKKMILNQLVTSMQTLILDLALLGLEFDSEGEFTVMQNALKTLKFNTIIFISRSQRSSSFPSVNEC